MPHEKIKIAIITGTRPELIKLSVLIRLIQKDPEMKLLFIHSGQHYDSNMFQIFLKELELPHPDYNINVGSHPNTIQTGKMLINFYDILEGEKPDIILAQGDTNTVFAAALTAFKIGIPFGHIEAGIRSFDMRMPEEINRMLTGECSLLNFAPTKRAVANLMNEGIASERIFLTGNPIVDAINKNKKLAKKKSKIISNLVLQEKRYALVTLHRASNVDNKLVLEGFLETLVGLEEIPMVFPMHPRTRKNVDKFKLNVVLHKAPHIKLIEPVGYLDMLQLMANAYCIITDSGGLQEEAVILRIPCLTLRENTERPESVEIGANLLLGNSASLLNKYLSKIWKDEKFYQSMIPHENPFGYGTASQQIVDIIKTKAREKTLKIPYLTYSDRIPNYKLKIVPQTSDGISISEYENLNKCKVVEIFDQDGVPVVGNRKIILKTGYYIKGLYLEKYQISISRINSIIEDR